MNINRCFEILETSPDSTYEDTKAAYRLLAQVWHPDKHSHNEKILFKATSKIKELNAAWSEIEVYFKNESTREADAREADARESELKASEKREKSQRAEQERKLKEAAEQAELEKKVKSNKSRRPSNSVKKPEASTFMQQFLQDIISYSKRIR